LSIKFLTIDAPKTSTDDAGVVTATGVQIESSITDAAIDVVTMPFQLFNDDKFVSGSAAAISSIAWGFTLAHVVDAVHVSRGAEAFSPITKFFMG